MPTKSYKSGKPPTGDQSALSKGKKPGGGKPGGEKPGGEGNGGFSDPPIIVQGGGSVDVDVPRKFNANGTGPNGGKKFKHGLGNLTNMEITNAGSCTVDPATGVISVTLNRTSKISINYA